MDAEVKRIEESRRKFVPATDTRKPVAEFNFRYLSQCTSIRETVFLTPFGLPSERLGNYIEAKY